MYDQQLLCVILLLHIRPEDCSLSRGVEARRRPAVRAGQLPLLDSARPPVLGRVGVTAAVEVRFDRHGRHQLRLFHPSISDNLMSSRKMGNECMHA